MPGVLLIDLDNTLVERDVAFRVWAEGFVDEHSLQLSAVEELIEVDGDGFVPRRDVMAFAAERFGLSHSVDDLLAGYRERYPLAYQPVGVDLRNALEDARASGWRIAIVTNGPPTQMLKIERAGLDELVDACCISEVEGVRKPEAGIFQRATSKCECDIVDAWVIGDNPHADIGGAHGLGLPSVWLHRGRTWSTVDYRPTFTRSTVVEAIEAATARGTARP